MYMLYIQASLYSVCCDVRGGGGVVLFGSTYTLLISFLFINIFLKAKKVMLAQFGCLDHFGEVCSYIHCFKALTVPNVPTLLL